MICVFGIVMGHHCRPTSAPSAAGIRSAPGPGDPTPPQIVAPRWLVRRVASHAASDEEWREIAASALRTRWTHRRDGSFGREWLHQLDAVAERIVDIDPLITVEGFVISDGDFCRF